MGGNSNSPSSDSGVIDYTHTFSSRLLNELRIGFSRNKTFITVQDSGFDASKIFVDAAGNPLPGIVDASSNQLDSGLPTIGIGGGFAPRKDVLLTPTKRMTMFPGSLRSALPSTRGAWVPTFAAKTRAASSMVLPVASSISQISRISKAGLHLPP
jgi:hypothetical protein